MDFTKFVSLIDSSRLYFTRPDKFDDPFEGSVPKRNLVPFLSGYCRNMREEVAINCWHLSEYESAAIWKLYLKSDEGIAIQSTYSRLRQSFINSEPIFLGTVTYIDYEKDEMVGGHVFTPHLHKRRSFEHEREVRAIIDKTLTGDKKNQITIEHGVKIKVDLELLIDKIYVAPNAPNWLSDLVEAVVNRYGYNFKVVHSDLNKQPIF